MRSWQMTPPMTSSGSRLSTVMVTTATGRPTGAPQVKHGTALERGRKAFSTLSTIGSRMACGDGVAESLVMVGGLVVMAV
jgi:hypothetical protein